MSRWRRRWVALLVPILCLTPGATTAGSPSPDVSPSAPIASPAVDCSDLAASIPERVRERLGLEAAATSGVEGIDPDDLLDPLLRSLALDRTDVCGVTLRTSDPARAGMLLRIRGGGPDLAEALAAALAERLRSYGQDVSEDALEVGGAPAARLLVGPASSATALLVIAVTADSVLLTGSSEIAEALLAAQPQASRQAPAGSPASPAPSAHG